MEAGQVSALRQGREATGQQAGLWEVDTEQASEQIHDTPPRALSEAGVWLSRVPDTHFLKTMPLPPLREQSGTRDIGRR